LINNRWEEQGEAVKRRSSHEEHDEDHDDVRGSDGSQDFFGTEFVNRFNGWPIPFQAVHNDAKDSRVPTSKEMIFELKAHSF